MKPRDSLSHLYLCYRKKLHQFLVSSTFYDPVKLLNILNPKFLHEKALILTRLGKYEDALFVYCCELKDFTLAETYCDQLFLIVKNLHNNEIASTKQSFYNKEMIRLVPDSIKPNVNEASEIYTMLFKVWNRNL